ncbi:hypothetical protein CBW18_18510 [Pedobacter sp. AJM]|nr:hypothetical protein CBW18_18510 [Pedobacter sp. AJM]
MRDEIKNYVSGNAGKRNAVLITQIEIQIVQLQNKRKNFEGELWVDDTTKHSQVGLFDSNLKNPSIFKVDKNLQERNKIDADIKILQAQIVKEQNKAVNVVAEKEIETIAKWNPYDQNSSSPFFDLEWMFGLDNGFDLVIGNPPYVQLQKNEGKLSKMLENLGYKTFVKTGDIYSIFYERGWQLLRNKGFLCFITSNKWMRAGYGESTREFFANNTNPILLVDFAGQKIFESATVDTNILLFSKEKNKQQTRACVIREKVLNNLSVYFRQNSTLCDFSSSDSWVILSGIEQKIKAKIEAVGVPLKNWDINIYRGILTGYNEAFIINGKKKDELIAEDPKSAEIIRPLLRGRDIKRYSHEFDNLYLITTFPSLKINIELYPAVRQHLISFGYDRLKQTGDKGARKKTNNQWFETQDSISYWEDFSKQKIVWKRIGSILRFSYDDTGIMALDSTCFATGKHIKYLVAVLNSKMGRYLMKDAPQTGTGDLLISVQAIEPLKIPIPNSIDENLINQIVDTLLNNSDDISSDLVLEIDRIVYNLYNLDTDECSFIESQRTQ